MRADPECANVPEPDGCWQLIADPGFFDAILPCKPNDVRSIALALDQCLRNRKTIRSIEWFCIDKRGKETNRGSGPIDA